MIAKLHYITYETGHLSFEQQVNNVLSGGAKWIQYRRKNKNAVDTKKEASILFELCKSKSATFIINDDVDLALAINADGVHVGREDEHPTEVRKKLGPNKIIGVTANSLEDILELAKYKINYIGLGPFRFTDTKKNLSPILGIEGYKMILEALKQKNIIIPLIAIGGILPNDVASLLETGLHGIAVSGAIANSENGIEQTKLFNQLIHSSQVYG